MDIHEMSKRKSLRCKTQLVKLGWGGLNYRIWLGTWQFNFTKILKGCLLVLGLLLQLRWSPQVIERRWPHGHRICIIGTPLRVIILKHAPVYETMQKMHVNKSYQSTKIYYTTPIPHRPSVQILWVVHTLLYTMRSLIMQACHNYTL